MRTLILAVLMIPGSAWGLGGAITETPGPSVTPSSAAATYVNKAGDTMTGPLGGTVGSFSGSVTASSGTILNGFNVAVATFTVATTGIVTAPSQPVVISTRATDQNTVSGSWTTLYFGGDTKRENIGHDITNSSGTFTFAYAGTYSVSCSFIWSANNSGSRNIGFAFHGDIIWGPRINSASAGSVEAQSFSTVVYADAGDTIACQGFQNSSTDLPFACSTLSTQSCRMAVVRNLQ